MTGTKQLRNKLVELEDALDLLYVQRKLGMSVTVQELTFLRAWLTELSNHGAFADTV